MSSDEARDRMEELEEELKEWKQELAGYEQDYCTAQGKVKDIEDEISRLEMVIRDGGDEEETRDETV